MMFGFFKNRRRQKLLQQPLPTAWRAIIERNVAIYSRLSPAERLRLEATTLVLASERPFIGCRGLQIDDEVKVTIGAQAALLLLGEEGYYFERVPSIIVYPQSFTRRHAPHEQVQEDVELLGEAWQSSSIVLSWPAVLAGGRSSPPGQNLVLHEFAHHLDGLDGEMGGAPPLPTYAAQHRWREVFDREYAALCTAVSAGKPTLLDEYGATKPAEMFAVATECFFGQPVEMRHRHGDLYECFRGFYKVDPANWFVTSPTPTRRASEDDSYGDDEDDDPTTPAELPPLPTADAYFTRGHEYFEIGRYDLAEADFNQAVRLSPDDQESLVYRAESRFWLEDVEAALADADRACRLDPQDMAALRIRGICRVSLHQDREGLADLARAIEPASDDTDALFFRGLAHVRLGQVQEALPNFHRVLELDPDDAEAYDLRADCWDKLGNHQSAARDRKRADELRQDEEP